jgi:hypothetical protein
MKLIRQSSGMEGGSMWIGSQRLAHGVAQRRDGDCIGLRSPARIPVLSLFQILPMRIEVW